MKHNKYLLITLMVYLLIGWTGCSESPTFTDNVPEPELYNARLITCFRIQAESLDTDMPSVTRADNGNVILSDMWYAIFDASTEKIVASANGEKIRHLTITGNQLDPMEEQLPPGDYILSFLVMAAGGDAKAMQPVEALSDEWLKAAPDGTVNGDFFYGQGRTTIPSKQTSTVDVTMSRISGLFKVETKMIDTSQEEFLSKTELILNAPLPYGAMTAGGVMIPATNESPQAIDIATKGNSFFALVPPDTPVSCDGQLLVTLTEGAKNHQRLYQMERMKLERAKRTSYTLNLNLPFNRLGCLDQSAVISKKQLFAIGETEKEIVSRQFQLNNPLKVTFSHDAASVQFFSPVGVGRTEIYARIKTTQDYFKVYELDTIRPFDDLSLRLTLLNNEEGYYLTENGRILRIPVGNNLTNNELEYKVVCQSDYWKKLEKIQLDPTIGFFDGKATDNGGVAYNMQNTLTPKRARMIVGMLLNWGVMLSSPIFKQTLDEWPSPKLDAEGKAHKDFYWPNTDTTPVYVSKDEIHIRLTNFFGKGHIDFAVHTPESAGAVAVGVVIPKGGHHIYSLWDEVYMTAFTPYEGYGYVPYHELAHLMGYPDNYGCGENTMASIGFVGWTDLCALVFQDMSSRNELPVSSLEILDSLSY